MNAVLVVLAALGTLAILLGWGVFVFIDDHPQRRLATPTAPADNGTGAEPRRAPPVPLCPGGHGLPAVVSTGPAAGGHDRAPDGRVHQPPQLGGCGDPPAAAPTGLHRRRVIVHG